MLFLYDFSQMIFTFVKMRTIFTYLCAIVISALVFYGGAGLNVVSYCCNQCRSVGIEAISDHGCCEIHEHHHTHDITEVLACGSCISHADDNCCGITRLQHDWNTISQLEFNLKPIAIDLFFIGFSDISLIPNPIFEEITSIMPTGPPLRTPQAYLSLLTTLLIWLFERGSFCCLLVCVSIRQITI